MRRARHRRQLPPSESVESLPTLWGPISKTRIGAILSLMEHALSKKAPAGTACAVVQVPVGKLYTASSTTAPLMPLLKGEAAGFLAMWESAPGAGFGFTRTSQIGSGGFGEVWRCTRDRDGV